MTKCYFMFGRDEHILSAWKNFLANRFCSDPQLLTITDVWKNIQWGWLKYLTYGRAQQKLRISDAYSGTSPPKWRRISASFASQGTDFCLWTRPFCSTDEPSVLHLSLGLNSQSFWRIYKRNPNYLYHWEIAFNYWQQGRERIVTSFISFSQERNLEASTLRAWVAAPPCHQHPTLLLSVHPL